MNGNWHSDKRLPAQAALRKRGTSENMRDRLGCICTLRDEETGRIVTLQRNGFRLEALQAIAEWCDLTPGDWKIVSYSTPGTILADLSGERSSVTNRQQTTQSQLELPEMGMLGRIGRFDLVAPELLAHTSADERRTHHKPRRTRR